MSDHHACRSDYTRDYMSSGGTHSGPTGGCGRSSNSKDSAANTMHDIDVWLQAWCALVLAPAGVPLRPCLDYPAWAPLPPPNSTCTCRAPPWPTGFWGHTWASTVPVLSMEAAALSAITTSAAERSATTWSPGSAEVCGCNVAVSEPAAAVATGSAAGRPRCSWSSAVACASVGWVGERQRDASRRVALSGVTLGVAF